MSDVLSQLEIDSLLNDMSAGSVNIDDILSHNKSTSEISNYDFRRPNRISKNQVRTLQNVHESFSESFGFYLVSKLQSIVSINVTSVDQLFYSEFILSVSNPSCLYVFDIEGTDGSGIMEISPQLALTIVERLLGGTTDSIPKSRVISPIEQAVIKGVIVHALSDLGNAWRSIAEISFKYSRLEMEADFVQIAPSSEIVIIVSLDVNIGSNTFLMNLCFPTFALEEVLARLNKQKVTTQVIKQSPSKARENMEILHQQISTTSLPVIAELGKAAISLKELMELKVGDVIKVKKHIQDEIEVIIAGRRKLGARPGSIEGKKAVRITSFLNEEDLVDEDLSHKD